MVHKGEKYRSRKPIQVTVMTEWAAPYTGGEKATLPAGEVFTITNDPPPNATAVYCRPERYNELHELLVKESDRKSRKYRGYYLSSQIAAILEKCERIAAS